MLMYSQHDMNTLDISELRWWGKLSVIVLINLNPVKFPKSSDFMYITCVTKNLIMRPSPLKIKVEPFKFLERIQGDICGPIKQLSRPFRRYLWTNKFLERLSAGSIRGAYVNWRGTHTCCVYQVFSCRVYIDSNRRDSQIWVTAYLWPSACS
jgi:hypothetical protein